MYVSGRTEIRILVVEDETAILEWITISLRQHGYQVYGAQDGEKGADLVEQMSFDLILLDIMLPKVDGYELMEYIAPTHIPVIFLTAKGTAKDRIKGLKLGADDYITKPFEMEELLLRIEALLRRTGKLASKLHSNGFTIDMEKHQVIRDKDNVEIPLTPRERELFVMLVRNKNRVLSREQLFEQIWETEYAGDTRTLDLHIQRLRKKLELKEQIRTVFREGYLLTEEDT